MVVDGLSEENNDRDSEPWEKINNDITLWKKHYDNIEKHLGTKSNVMTLIANANEIYRMSILIAAASYCEIRLTAMMKKIYEERTGSTILSEFVHKRALNRQFHTLFDWKAKGDYSKGANRFYSMFGKNFADHIKNQSKIDKDFKRSQESFVKIGALRNELAHEGSITSSYTVTDVLDLFDSAKVFFVKFFEHLESQMSIPGPRQTTIQ